MKKLFFLLIVSSFLISSCRFFGYERIYGNGVLSSKEQPMEGISGVRVKGGLDVFVSQGTSSTVKLEGDQNLLEYIEVVKQGNIVEVYTRRGVHLKPSRGLKVYVTAPSLNELYIDGSGDIKTQSKISNANVIRSEIRGSGDIMLDVDAPQIDASIAGSGDIVLKGNTRMFRGSIAGAGDIKCFDLLSETADIDIKGSGNAEVFASRQLNADIKGAGDVQYKGNATVSQSIRGSGSVSKVQ